VSATRHVHRTPRSRKQAEIFRRRGASSDTQFCRTQRADQKETHQPTFFMHPRRITQRMQWDLVANHRARVGGGWGSVVGHPTDWRWSRFPFGVNARHEEMAPSRPHAVHSRTACFYVEAHRSPSSSTRLRAFTTHRRSLWVAGSLAATVGGGESAAALSKRLLRCASLRIEL
jgi:hypothetical protein